MKSHAYAAVRAGGVLGEVRSGPPLTVRRVRSDNARTCRLCLVNSAAGPLAGDDVSFELVGGPGAQIELVSAGAAIAQGRRGGEPGRLLSTVRLEEGARLAAQPAPLIACSGSNVDVQVSLQLAETAAVQWQETLVLGRAGEAAGAVTLRWNVTRAGLAVLRSTVDLADPSRTSWPGMTSGRRVMVTVVISDPDYVAVTEVLDATAVRQAVDKQTVVITVLDDDAASAQRRLARLLPP